MHAFLLMIIAIVMTVLLVPFAVLAQIVRHLVMGKSLSAFWWDVAIGLDQLGCAVLYGEPDWTVSSRTHWLAKYKGNQYAAVFEKLIDAIFGRSHCRESFTHEFGGKAP